MKKTTMVLLLVLLPMATAQEMTVSRNLYWTYNNGTLTYFLEGELPSTTTDYKINLSVTLEVEECEFAVSPDVVNKTYSAVAQMVTQLNDTTAIDALLSKKIGDNSEMIIAEVGSKVSTMTNDLLTNLDQRLSSMENINNLTLKNSQCESDNNLVRASEQRCITDLGSCNEEKGWLTWITAGSSMLAVFILLRITGFKRTVGNR